MLLDNAPHSRFTLRFTFGLKPLTRCIRKQNNA
jgi:hypothetical protein